MTKSRIFLLLLLSFIGGVFMRSFLEINDVWKLLLILLCIILLVVFYKNPWAAVAAFMLGGFALGIWKTDNLLQEANEGKLAGKNIEGRATVLKSTESTFGKNLIIEFEDLKARMLLQVPFYPEFEYGDVLAVKCNAQIIENKNADFDYRMYMAKDGVFYKCEDKKYKKISSDGGNLIMRNVIKMKNNFENNITDLMPLPEGVLASGILFGGSDGLPEEIKNDFSRTGMTHIVAVSGYNVTIIAEYLILLGIFIGLWRKQAIWFALSGIMIFVVMIGLPASAVRAGVMSSILLWAIKNGRLASSENAIILAGAIMLAINPLLLRWDIGFQLSFLATLGIVITSPLWEKSFVKKHKAWGISEMIALSLSAQVFVLPIIAYNFKNASLISLLANVLILPIVPLSILLVFLVSLTGFIFMPLASVLAWLSYLPLYYEISVIHILSQFPLASIEVGNFSAWWIVFYYIMLMSVVLYVKNRKCEKNASNTLCSHEHFDTLCIIEK